MDGSGAEEVGGVELGVALGVTGRSTVVVYSRVNVIVSRIVEITVDAGICVVNVETVPGSEIVATVVTGGRVSVEIEVDTTVEAGS